MENAESTKLQLVYELNNINLEANTESLTSLILNPADKDDEKISYQLYNLSLAILPLIKDPVFTKNAIKLARKNKNQTVSISDLAELDPNVKMLINNALKSSNTSIYELSKNMTYDNGESIDQYIPSIFIPNLSILDENLQPILSPNIEADSDKNPALEDKIVAWYYTADGDKKEILISEEESLKTLNPLFILDDASDFSNQPSTATLSSVTSESTSAKVQADVFESNQYRINHRYERRGKSDFTVMAYRIDPNGVIHWIHHSSGRKILHRVKKKDIGKDLSGWHFFSNKDTPYSTNYYVYNTFERDWYSSPKPLGSFSANGVTLYLEGRRRYDGEWYAFPPNSLQRANLQGVHNSGSNGLNIYSNHKGYLRVYK